MRAVISGKDLPEDVKQQMIALHEENANLKDSYKTAQDKLLKARAVCVLSSVACQILIGM